MGNRNGEQWFFVVWFVGSFFFFLVNGLCRGSWLRCKMGLRLVLNYKQMAYGSDPFVRNLNIQKDAGQNKSARVMSVTVKMIH